MATNTKQVKKRRFSFAAIGRFFKEVVAELKRVSWPSRKDLVTYTLAVVAFSIFMVAFIGLLDLGFAQAMRLIVGKGG